MNPSPIFAYIWVSRIGVVCCEVLLSGKLIFQALVTVGLLVWLFSRMDLQTLRDHLFSVNPAWFALAVAIYFCNLLISAIRWRLILQGVQRYAPFALLLRLNLVGAFFNQVLPGAVSGDAIRAYYTRPHSGGFSVALAVVLAERLLGLAALFVLVLLAYLGFGSHLPAQPQLLWVLGLLFAGYVGGMSVLLSARLDPWVRRLGRAGEKIQKIQIAFRQICRPQRGLVWILFWSLWVQLLSIALFWSVARALGLELAPLALWMVWPLVTLLTVIPISLAGWGLREGLLVFYLTGLGVAADQALMLSLLTGFAVLLAGLPGGLVWIFMGRTPWQRMAQDIQHES